MNQEIKKMFCELLGRDHVLTDEPMKQHTTFKIGGPADYFWCRKQERKLARS